MGFAGSTFAFVLVGTMRACPLFSGESLKGKVARMEMRLEVVQVPVSDVDRAKAFYTEKLGFVLDHDVEHVPGMRVVQLTPPGSPTSVVIGTGMTSMAPGSLEGLQLVVPDLPAVRTELVERGAGVSEVQDMGGVLFAHFTDPDGNRWVLQGATPPAVRDAHTA
jgi:catechol 2,3-dioxygenase-like lactoylglutathione lyase family enzyme